MVASGSASSTSRQRVDGGRGDEPALPVAERERLVVGDGLQPGQASRPIAAAMRVGARIGGDSSAAPPRTIGA